MDLALFDFDGTITTRDTFTAFLRFSSSRFRRLTGGTLLAPLALGYKQGWIPGTRARPIAAYVALRGRRVPDLERLGRTFADEFISACLRPEAMEAIQFHKKRSDSIIVVSASLDVYLTPWCRSMGVQLISTELEHRNSRYTGWYIGSECSGAEKRSRILTACDLTSYQEIYAHGDTDEDYSMLSIATRRFLRGREVECWPPPGYTR